MFIVPDDEFQSAESIASRYGFGHLATGQARAPPYAWVTRYEPRGEQLWLWAYKPSYTSRKPFFQIDPTTSTDATCILNMFSVVVLVGF